MKNFRRILALIVTLTMLFSMTAPAISEGVVDPTPVETPVEEKKDEKPVEEKKDETPAEETKDETPAAPTEEKGETPAAPAEEKGETPAAPTEEKGETPAAPAEETKDEAPAAPTEETKDETPAAPTEETKDETPAAPTEETKDETPAAPTEEKKDETPAAPAEETAPASTGETAEQAPAQEPVPAAGNKEETQEAPAPAQTEEAQPVVQETAPAAAAAAAQTEEEPVPVQEETTDGVEPAMANGSSDSPFLFTISGIVVDGNPEYGERLKYHFTGFEIVEGGSTSQGATPEFASAFVQLSNYDGIYEDVTGQEKTITLAIQGSSSVKYVDGAYWKYVNKNNHNSSDYSTTAKITVQKAPLTITATVTPPEGSEDNTSYYNGSEQTATVTYTATGLKNNNMLDASCSSATIKGKDVGTYGVDSLPTWKIVKSDGTTDSTGNYDISAPDVGNATFAIKAVPVTVGLKSDFEYSSYYQENNEGLAQAFTLSFEHADEALLSEAKEGLALGICTDDATRADVDVATAEKGGYAFKLKKGEIEITTGDEQINNCIKNFWYTFKPGDQKYYIKEDNRTEVDVEVTLRNKFPDHIYDGKPYIPQFDDTVCSYSVQTASGTNLNTNIIKSVRSSNECTALGIYTWNTTMPPAVELDSDHKLRNLTVKGSTTLLIKEAPVTIDVPVTFTKDEVTYDGASHSLVPSVANSRVSYTSQISGDMYNYSVTVAVNNTAQYTEAGDHVYTADSVTVTLEPEEGQNAWMPDATANVTLAQTEAERTLTIKPKSITVTPVTNGDNAANWTSVYGEAIGDFSEDFTFAPEKGEGQSDFATDKITLVSASELTNTSNVGEYNVKFQFEGEDITGNKKVYGNYEYTFDVGTAKYTITPKAVTVTPDTTGDNAAKWTSVYGENIKDFSEAYVFNPPHVDGQSNFATDKIKLVSKETIDKTSDAGKYNVKFQFDGADITDNKKVDGNYEYTFDVGTAKYEITKLPVTLKLGDKTVEKIYGEKDPDFTENLVYDLGEYAGIVTPETAKTGIAATIEKRNAAGTEEGEAADTYTYTKAWATDGFTIKTEDSYTNYEVTIDNTTDPTFKFVIKPMPVTLSLAGKPEKFYGEEDPIFDDFVVAAYGNNGTEYTGTDNTKDIDTIKEELKANAVRDAAGTEEDAGTYGYEKFSITPKGDKASNYDVVKADTVAEEDFLFTIKPLPVTLSLAGSPTKVYSDVDPDFTEYLVASYTDAEYKTENSKTPSSTEPDAKVSPILTELEPTVTRLEEEGSENAGTYLYEKFTITPTENPNYEVTIAPAADVDEETFSFTIFPLTVYLTLEGHPWKYYSVTDAKADYEDFTEFVKIELPETEQDENGEFHYLGEIKPSDVEKVIAPVATRPGAAKDKVTNEAKEQVGTYGYEDFDITFTEDDNFFVQTIHQLKEQEAADELEIIEDPDFDFKIEPLPVTLTLDGKPKKDYGVTDADAGIDFNDFLTTTCQFASSKTPEEMVSELKATVTRADAGKLSDEKVGVYEYSKAKFPIDPNPTENNNYDVTVAKKADKFTFTIKPNITIGEMKWTEGNVTTRTGNTIKASFTVPSGKPDVTLDVPMTVTAKLDLSGTNTYLTDEAKAALSALELTGTFTGKTGEIVIPEPDAMKKYVKNGDSWQGGLPVGTKLIVTGVKLGDAEGTVNGAAPAVPVSGFEVAKHEVALTMGVETVGGDAQTAYKVGENSYVVGPEATITLSHDSPLDEYVILTSTAGSKTVLVPANDTVSIKASEMNAGEYEVLGVVTCEDGLYKADSVVMTEITAAMVDDVHLDANTETGEFVLDNVANKNVKAQFENRGKQVTVTLPEATRPGSPVTVTINGMTIPAQTADGTTVTFDVFGIWSANPQNLIRSGEAINVTYTDAVGNVLTAPVSGGSVTKSAGNKITINMRTIDDDDVGSVGGDGKVRIYGEASNYEKVIISVNGTTVAIVDVTGSGNYDPSKSGQWSYVLNLADLDLSTGRVTITAVYDDLTGGDERTFNYKGEVMPVLLTSPLLEQFDKIYGFAEYGTTVHVTINGEDYNTDDNPEMFLTDDAGNTVSVYEHFPSEHDSYFYWIFQCPSRMKPDDDIQIWYEDFTGENVTPEDKRGVQVQAVSDTDAKFDNTAEVLGANVIDYLYMDKDEDGKDIPGTGEMGHNFVTPVDLNKIKEEPLTLPVLAFDGYKVGQVTFSMDDAGQLVVTPEIADDSEGAVKWGVSLFGEKPSIQALRANACGDDLAEKTFNVNGFGDKVWVSARFDVDLSYMRIGGMQDFCALAPHDSSSNNRLQSYAANLGDDNYKFYSESLSEPVIEPEVTED